MYIKEKKQTHLFKILEDKQFAKMYFKNKKIEDYNHANLLELQYQIDLAKKEYVVYLGRLTRAAVLLGIESVIIDELYKTKEKQEILTELIRKKEYFESDLIYLFVTNKITTKEFKDLGYDDKYISNAFDIYESEIENPYITYYYEESTERTYERKPNGKYVYLQKTPDIVKSAILELEQEKQKEYTLSRNNK